MFNCFHIMWPSDSKSLPNIILLQGTNKGAFTPGPFFFVPNQFAYFPWVVLCLHRSIVKRAKVPYTLPSLPHVCWSHWAEWNMEHDDNYNNINLVINQVKCLMDIWADEHSSQMLNNTRVNKRKRGAECPTVSHQDSWEVRSHIVHFDQRSFGATMKTGNGLELRAAEL